MANRAGAKEQTRFEKCVRKDVEYRWQPGAGHKIAPSGLILRRRQTNLH